LERKTNEESDMKERGERERERDLKNCDEQKSREIVVNI
jgi:hypothetical protein